jgi:predicted metal-dependent hydrolase
MKFELDESMPRYWHSDSPYITHFFTALSVVFPEGEKFFIDSVRNFEDQIEDPKTRHEVREFVKQEAHHTYQHRKYNSLVEAQGFDLKAYDRAVGRALRFFRKVLTEKAQLATTVALEHFTATLAHQLLTNPNVTDGMHPMVKPLWLWHAVEETEHKAVGWDVYEQVGGSYLTRMVTWARIVVGFPLGITIIQLSLLASDGKLFDFADMRRGLRFVWGKGGVLRSILPELRAFFRRDFHPWQASNQNLIPAWTREYGRYVVER